MQFGPLSSRSRVIWALRKEERKQGGGDREAAEGKGEMELVEERERNILFWEVKRDGNGPTL